MSLAVLVFPDVPSSIGICVSAVTIVENSRCRTGRKSKTLSHQKQTSQQNKDAGHPQIIPYIRREIIEANQKELHDAVVSIRLRGILRHWTGLPFVTFSSDRHLKI